MLGCVGGRNHGFLGPGGFDHWLPKTEAVLGKSPVTHTEPKSVLQCNAPSLVSFEFYRSTLTSTYIVTYVLRTLCHFTLGSSLYNSPPSSFSFSQSFILVFQSVKAKPNRSMEAKDEFQVDHLSLNTPTGTSFSQLLFEDDDEDDSALDHTYNLTRSPVFPIHKPPKMLCFGSYQNEGDLLLPETNATPQISVITSSDSSSASSCNHSNTSFNSLPKSSNSLQKKRNGSAQEAVTKPGVGGQKPLKKTKAENPTPTGHAKRKEKLGERIAALQQLVSPFGKTLPAYIATQILKFGKEGSWTLRVSDGPNFIDYPCKLLSSKPNQAKFGNGWSTFCKQNQLKKNDQCTFKSCAGQSRLLSVFFVRSN